MFKNLLAAIEGEINKVVEQEEQSPGDINLATKKLLLLRLAKNYLYIENEFKKVAALNNIY